MKGSASISLSNKGTRSTHENDGTGDMSPEDVLVSGYAEAAVLLDTRTGAVVTNTHADRVSPFFTGSLHKDIADVVNGARDTGRVGSVVMTMPTENGQVVYDVTAIPNVLGQKVLMLFRNQTLDSNLRDALVESRQRFKDLVEISSDFSWEVGENGTFVFVSRAHILGYDADHMIGRDPADFIIDVDEYDPIPFLAHKRMENVELWMKRADGGMSCFQVSAMPFFEVDGEHLGVRGVCRDITLEREKAAALAHANQREQVLSYIVKAIRDEIEPHDMLETAVAATARALGASGCRVLRTSWDYTGTDQEHGKLFFDTAAEYGSGGPGQLGDDVLIFNADRAWLREEEIEGWNVMAAPCLHGGKINGVITLWKRADWTDDDRLLVSDISNQLGIAIEQIEKHESIVRLSRTDAMTGLLNRRAFYDDELPRRFNRMELNGGSGALFYIDMDNFKLVNDIHGHQRGDEAIIALCDMMHDFVRPGDLIARLGGDEFALWLDGVDEQTARARSRDLLSLSEGLQAFSGSNEKPLGISIGIAVYEPGKNEDLNSLLARADAAMYEVKQSSKGDYRLAPPYGAED